MRLIGLAWAVPDFNTLSRRQKTLKVNIPRRGSDAPLHLLLIDIEPWSRHSINAVRRSFPNGFTALGTPITEVAG